MMPKLSVVLSYLRYLIYAKTKNTIHSPFLYNLINTVFTDRTKHPEYRKIERLRKSLLAEDRLVTVSDFGAGSVVRTPDRPIREITRTSSKPVRFGRLLFRLSKHFRPETIIELGTSVGLSSAWLAAGNPEARVFTIEGCSELAAIAAENFRKLNLYNISLINGNFDDELPGLLSSLNKVDLVFIDGNHKREPTVSYFEQCLAKSVNETCFVIDDIHWSEEMKQAWKDIKNNKRVTMTVDLFFSGIVFINRGLSKQDIRVRF
jgi:predicted O-methyltransferase YrrM